MSILIFPHIQRASSVCSWNSNCSERFSVHSISCHFCYHFHLTLKEINSTVNFVPRVMLSCDSLSVSSNTDKSPWEADRTLNVPSTRYAARGSRPGIGGSAELLVFIPPTLGTENSISGYPEPFRLWEGTPVPNPLGSFVSCLTLPNCPEFLM